MKRVSIAIIIAFTLLVVARAQTPKKVSLVVSSYDREEKTYPLYRYNFENGEFVSKELIAKSENINFHFGLNRIYQNRYALSDNGDVIDIEKKKILFKSDGDLHRIDGNKIYVLVRTSDVSGLFVYDLISSEYKLVNKIEDIFGFGSISPNGVRSALYTCSDCGIRIFEYGGREKLIKGKFTVQRDGLNTSALNQVPIFWLSEEKFLTQTKNGSLVTVTLDGKITPIVEFEIKGLQSRNPQIYRNDDGKIIYRYITEYEIDVENKTYKNLNNSVGNDFSIENVSIYERKFFYNGVEIGRFDAARYPKTIDGYLVSDFMRKNKTTGDSDGIKVWNTIKKDWTTIKIDWSPQIVGWVTE